MKPRTIATMLLALLLGAAAAVATYDLTHNTRPSARAANDDEDVGLIP